jgi:hypothetical protein
VRLRVAQCGRCGRSVSQSRDETLGEPEVVDRTD